MKQVETTPTKPEEAQAEPRQAALRDLYWKTAGFLPAGRLAVLQAVKDKLALLEVADTPEGEKACVDKIVDRFRAWKHVDLARVCVGGCVRELCYYRRDSRLPILEATLTQAKAIAAAAEQIIKLRPSLLRTYRALPAEMKALLLVTDRLERTDGMIEGGLVAKVLDPVRDKADVDVLRDDPKLAKLLEAFDLATEILNES